MPFCSKFNIAISLVISLVYKLIGPIKSSAEKYACLTGQLLFYDTLTASYPLATNSVLV